VDQRFYIQQMCKQLLRDSEDERHLNTNDCTGNGAKEINAHVNMTDECNGYDNMLGRTQGRIEGSSSKEQHGLDLY